MENSLAVPSPEPVAGAGARAEPSPLARFTVNPFVGGAFLKDLPLNLCFCSAGVTW